MENQSFNDGRVTVKIDHSAVELQERERADKAEAKIRELEQKETDRIKAEFEEKKQMISEKFRDMVSDEKTLAMAQRLAEQEQEAQSIPKKKPAVGVVGIPITPQRKGYSDFGDMVNDLRAREGTEPLAHNALNKMFEKMLEENLNGSPLGVMGKFNEFTGNQERSLADIYNEMSRRRRNLGEN